MIAHNHKLHRERSITSCKQRVTQLRYGADIQSAVNFDNKFITVVAAAIPATKAAHGVEFPAVEAPPPAALVNEATHLVEDIFLDEHFTEIQAPYRSVPTVAIQFIHGVVQYEQGALQHVRQQVPQVGVVLFREQEPAAFEHWWEL